VVTLLLNVADPVCAGQWGKAAFDAVGPLLLIGWAEAGPGLLRALSAANADPESQQSSTSLLADLRDGSPKQEAADSTDLQRDKQVRAATRGAIDLDEELVERARRADAEHWRRYRRPISAETLRKQLRVGAATSRTLVAVVRPNAPVGMPSPAQEVA
jgi:hypothetical protein